MIVELTNNSGDVDLYQWYRVRSIDNTCPDALYVCFLSARDLNGNALYVVPGGATALVEIKYREGVIN